MITTNSPTKISPGNNNKTTKKPRLKLSFHSKTTNLSISIPAGLPIPNLRAFAQSDQRALAAGRHRPVRGRHRALARGAGARAGAGRGAGPARGAGAGCLHSCC